MGRVKRLCRGCCCWVRCMMKKENGNEREKMALYRLGEATRISRSPTKILRYGRIKNITNTQPNQKLDLNEYKRDFCTIPVLRRFINLQSLQKTERL